MPNPRAKPASALVVLVFVVVLALAFDYLNGFHDTANAVTAAAVYALIRQLL